MGKSLEIPPAERAIILIEQAMAAERHNLLSALGKEPIVISTNQAIKIVGKKSLDAWEANKLIKPIIHNSAKNAKKYWELKRLHELQLSDTYQYFL